MKDPRLVVVEIALANLREVPQKALREFNLRGLASEVQMVVYSFLSLEDLEASGMLLSIEEAGKELREIWLSFRDYCSTPADLLNAAKIRFASIILSNLGGRVGRERRLYSGTDCFWGTVVSSEEFDGLRATVVDAVERYDIVTSMDVKGGRLAFAVLPPRRFGKHVSEGMFIEAEGSGRPGELALPTERGKGAIESVLREEAARLGLKL